MEEEQILLDEIVKSSDEAKQLIKKDNIKKRQPKSETPLFFEMTDSDNPVSLITLFIKFINDKKLMQQDLYDFCTKKCNGDATAGRAIANNTIDRLKKRRDMRASTIELLCEFLNVDVVLEDK